MELSARHLHKSSTSLPDFSPTVMQAVCYFCVGLKT